MRKKHIFIKIGIVAITAPVILFATLLFLGTHYPSSRPLTENETAFAKTIFLDEVDYDRVRIAEDSILTRVFPWLFTRVTLGNTIHIPLSPALTDAPSDQMPKRRLKLFFIHEMAHIWQYQHSGWTYLYSSARAQIAALLRSGSTAEAFYWRYRFLEKKDFSTWNSEEQAEAIGNYAIHLDFVNDISPTKDILATEGDPSELGCAIPLFSGRYCENGLDSSIKGRNEAMLWLKEECATADEHAVYTRGLDSSFSYAPRNESLGCAKGSNGKK